MRLLVRAGETVIRYVVWFLLFVLGVWALLEVRINLFDILIRMHVSGWSIPAITNFYLAIVILAWLAITVWMENYLTEPKDVRVFWRRAIRLTVIEAGVLAASYLLQAIV